MHVRVRGIFSVLQFIWNHVEKKFQQKCSNPISKSLRAWRLALGTFSSPTKRLARPTIWCRHDQQTQCLFVLSNRSDFALWRQGAEGHVDVRRYFSCRLGTHSLWYLLSCFIFLRPRFPAIYQPKTYRALPSSRNTQPLPTDAFKWIGQFLRVPDAEILRINGFDAYSFIWFLVLMLRIFVPIWILS